MMIQWNNLQKLLKDRGEKANLSRATGISTGNITDWFNPNKSAQPSANALIKVAEYFDCSVDYLMDRTDNKEIIPEPTFDQKHTMKDFSGIDISKKISYGINIIGTSMETDDENTIPDKSTVLVTTEFDYDELIGEAVIANINGVLVCKEYNIAEDGHLWLKSRNGSKSDEDRHIRNMDCIKIIGRVVKVISP